MKKTSLLVTGSQNILFTSGLTELETNKINCKKKVDEFLKMLRPETDETSNFETETD